MTSVAGIGIVQDKWLHSMVTDALAPHIAESCTQQAKCERCFSA